MMNERPILPGDSDRLFDLLDLAYDHDTSFRVQYDTAPGCEVRISLDLDADYLELDDDAVMRAAQDLGFTVARLALMGWATIGTSRSVPMHRMPEVYRVIQDPETVSVFREWMLDQGAEPGVDGSMSLEYEPEAREN